MLRSAFLAAAAFVATSTAATAAITDGLAIQTDYDAASATLRLAPDASLAARAASIAASAPKRGGLASVVDAALGRATFLWAGADAQPAALGALAPRALAEARARDFLGRNAAALVLSAEQIASARVSEVHDTGRGGVIVRLVQRAGSSDVFNRSLNVLMARDGRLIAISGYFADGAASGAERLDGRGAIASAFADLGGSLLAAALAPTTRRGDWQSYARPALAGGELRFDREPRVRKLWYAAAGNRLLPAWQVELIASRGGAKGGVGYVVSAVDGAVLFRKNLAADAAYSYRVFADANGAHQPYDSPLGNGYAPFPGGSPTASQPRSSATANLVTVESGPIATGDPWLPAGATTTTGNNVDAYLDSGLILGLPASAALADGYRPRGGDLRTSLTGPNSFDWPIAADADPSGSDARNAAIVNLFYLNNWLHDFWYDHGFNEAAGNAQASNLGRGGVEGDAIHAEGQDASGRNNANMLTPADGGSPRMQMYLFDGIQDASVQQAGSAAPKLLASTADFGPDVFDVTAELAIPADGGGVSLTDGCSRLPAVPVLGTEIPSRPDLALRGKIALVDRGTCKFTTKEQFAGMSGAVGMIVVQNSDDDPIPMGNADLPSLPVNLPITLPDLHQVPAMMIRRADAASFKNAIASGQKVTVRMRRAPTIDLDGTLDNQVIAHEFFHYVSNRLVGDGSGLSNTQGRGMGEGWSDFAALLLTVQPQDAAGGYAGAYPMGYYVTASFSPASYQYFGIRRMPYSRSFAINTLTFRHIQDGTALDGSAPIAFGADGASNSEVHNTGEVWAAMLHQCWTNVLLTSASGYDDSRARMMDALIAGLKLTPNAPTLLEARDALLAATLAGSPEDFAACGAGFAARGAGAGAVGPARSSTDNVGVTESYTAPTP